MVRQFLTIPTVIATTERVFRNSMNNESLGDLFQRFWPMVGTCPRATGPLQWLEPVPLVLKIDHYNDLCVSIGSIQDLPQSRDSRPFLPPTRTVSTLRRTGQNTSLSTRLQDKEIVENHRTRKKFYKKGWRDKKNFDFLFWFSCLES